MEKYPRTGALVYGYTVCIVAVITFLICVSSLLNAVFDLNDPLHSGFNPQGSPSLASYENYKMDILKNLPKTDAVTAPSEETMKAMYQAAREDKITWVKSQARRNLTISSILIAICAILFITHWRWTRQLTKPSKAGTTLVARDSEKMVLVD